MDLQRFASVWDTLITGYNQDINNANKLINESKNEMNQKINDYNTYYENTLNDYNALEQEQKANIDTWAETQKEQQQKQTDYNIGLINQAKEETAQQTKAEQANAYVDYQKGLNQFGGSSEELAARGLGGTGFAKNQDIAMNITYQNRVSAANSALQKANTEYQNQINQALLTNDAALAEIAYQQLAKQTELALQGFEYRQNLYNNKLSYEQSISDTYTSRINNYMNMIQSYKNSIANANAQKTSEAQWNKSYQLSKKQAAAAQKQSSYDDLYKPKLSMSSGSVTATGGAAATIAMNLSSDKAFKEYTNLDAVASKGVTKKELNNYLTAKKNEGVFNTKDVNYIKSLFGI